MVTDKLLDVAFETYVSLSLALLKLNVPADKVAETLGQSLSEALYRHSKDLQQEEAGH